MIWTICLILIGTLKLQEKPEKLQICYSHIDPYWKVFALAIDLCFWFIQGGEPCVYKVKFSMEMKCHCKGIPFDCHWSLHRLKVKPKGQSIDIILKNVDLGKKSVNVHGYIINISVSVMLMW